MSESQILLCYTPITETFKLLGTLDPDGLVYWAAGDVGNLIRYPEKSEDLLFVYEWESRLHRLPSGRHSLPHDIAIQYLCDVKNRPEVQRLGLLLDSPQTRCKVLYTEPQFRVELRERNDPGFSWFYTYRKWVTQKMVIVYGEKPLEKVWAPWEAPNQSGCPDFPIQAAVEALPKLSDAELWDVLRKHV